jgi:hypothetical protein
VVSRPEKFYAKMNIFILINEINKRIEKLEIKIGTDLLDKYEVARVGNYEICQKILEQVSTFKLGSAKKLIAQFYKRINTDLIYFSQTMTENSNAFLSLKNFLQTFSTYEAFENLDKGIAINLS